MKRIPVIMIASLFVIGIPAKMCIRDSTQIREAKSAKTLRTLQLRFEKYDLVICDEFGDVYKRQRNAFINNCRTKKIRGNLYVLSEPKYHFLLRDDSFIFVDNGHDAKEIREARCV